jgi:hypothetical protein
MKLVLFFFATISGIGLILSVASHVAGLLGIPGPLGDSAHYLHFGAVIVMIPAWLVMGRMTKHSPKNHLWNDTLRGCPRWMRSGVYVFFAYAVVNFVLFAMSNPDLKGRGPLPPQAVRGFSGHWMALYAAATAVFYSAVSLWDAGWLWKCTNGHPARPLAKFCPRCGEPVRPSGE